MIGAPHPGDFVLVQQLLDASLGMHVELHEEDVGEVDGEQGDGFIPKDLLVDKEDNEC